MDLLHLPPAALKSILSIACCDGGVTACSLRSVCRDLRDAVRPYRFSTVMGNGYDTTAALLCELRTIAKRGQSPLVHLFMCDENPPIGRQNPLASMRRMYGERFNDALDDMREDEIEGGMFMAEVLQIAASTLRSVTLITNGTFSPGMGRIFGKTAFPPPRSNCGHCRQQHNFQLSDLFHPRHAVSSFCRVRLRRKRCDTVHGMDLPVCSMLPST
jgi:hypothetical protein